MNRALSHLSDSVVVGTVGDVVRLRSPAEWGHPDLTDPKSTVFDGLTSVGVPFQITVFDKHGVTFRMHQLGWLPFMSTFAASGATGRLIGHMDGVFPLAEFDDPHQPGPGQIAGRWRVCAHPSWLVQVEDDPLGDPCRCPTALLSARGCTCGRFARERAARQRAANPGA